MKSVHSAKLVSKAYPFLHYEFSSLPTDLPISVAPGKSQDFEKSYKFALSPSRLPTETISLPKSIIPFLVEVFLCLWCLNLCLNYLPLLFYY
jgi:hypothetical protein